MAKKEILGNIIEPSLYLHPIRLFQRNDIGGYKRYEPSTKLQGNFDDFKSDKNHPFS